MAYVREKKVPGKDGKSYRYYQLVEGVRVDGKVRQRVIKHLGKHDSKAAAIQAAGLSPPAVVPKEEPKAAPKYIKKLRALHQEWRDNAKALNNKEFREALSRCKEAEAAADAAYAAHGERSEQYEAAWEAKEEPQRRRDAFYTHHYGINADIARRAMAIYDRLSPRSKERVRALNITPVEYALNNRELHADMEELFAERGGLF